MMNRFNMRNMRRVCLAACATWLVSSLPVSAEDTIDFTTRVRFGEDGAPVLVLRDAKAPAPVTVLLYNLERQFFTRTDVSLKPVEEGSEPDTGFIAELPVPAEMPTGLLAGQTADSKIDHAVVVRRPPESRHAEATEAVQVLSFVKWNRPQAPVQNYQVQVTDRPAAAGGPTSTLHLEMKPPKTRGAAPKVSLTWSVRDTSGTSVRTGESTLIWTDADRMFTVDVTPDLARSQGPYTLELNLKAPDASLNFEASCDFALPNARMPFSSFESDEPMMWFGHIGERTLPPDGFRKMDTGVHLSTYPMWPFPDVPRVRFDTEHARSGKRSLQIDYARTGQQRVYTRAFLPGQAVSAGFWVRGNGTGDQLSMVLMDRPEYSRSPWDRNVQFITWPLTTLDFTEWRYVSFPVLGDGLQRIDPSASNKDINGPISMLALVIDPVKPAKEEKADPAEASFHIDDLETRTQLPRMDRLSLEAAYDTPDRRLHPDAWVRLTIGSSFTDAIEDGRLMWEALDGHRESIAQGRLNFGVSANGYTQVTLPLADVAALNPPGPVTLKVTAMAPQHAGVRSELLLPFKAPTHESLMWDFESREIFSGFTLANMERIAGDLGKSRTDIIPTPDGADGSALSLPLTVTSNQTMGVVLHPAIPGQLSHITMKVRGSGHPVTLRPMLYDNGETHLVMRGNSIFPLESITIEGSEWQTVTIQAPPVPEGWDQLTPDFWNKPSYPLNLVLHVMSDTPGAEIRVDEITVSTHMLDEPTVRVTVQYPDFSETFMPGSPLVAELIFFGSDKEERDVGVKLQSFTGRTLVDETRKITLEPGSRHRLKVVESLPAGLYELRIDVGDEDSPVEVLTCVDLERFLGKEPRETLSSVLPIDALLGQMRKPIRIDWDNFEPVPGLYRYRWFNAERNRVSKEGLYELSPIFGFVTDWAGPEARDAMQAGSYQRVFANHLQVPYNLDHWSRYIREVMREYHAKFDEWVFWERPDDPTSPKGISPPAYRQMFNLLDRWRDLYAPESKLVAGGLTYRNARDYFTRMEEPDTLPFDVVEVELGVGDLSPEQAALTGFFDDLSDQLKLTETDRKVRVSYLDWSVSESEEGLSQKQQAAYHARATPILTSQGVPPYRVPVVNDDQTRTGNGIFFRSEFGNAWNIQHKRPYFLPKPAFYALMEARWFLEGKEFAGTVHPPSRRLDDNLAYLFTGKMEPQGTNEPPTQLSVMMWSTTGEISRYHRPAEWAEAQLEDAFGLALETGTDYDPDVLELGAFPLRVFFNSEKSKDELIHEIRMLRPLDGSPAPLLVLKTAEPASAARAGYQATGSNSTGDLKGLLPSGREIRAPMQLGVNRERFELRTEAPGLVLLKRLWNLVPDRPAPAARITLDDGTPEIWDLSYGEVMPYEPGPRESTYVLHVPEAGVHEVIVDYGDQPIDVVSWRAEPVGETVSLSDWGILAHAGALEKDRNARGEPLTIGNRTFTRGLGVHADSFVELPLHGLFEELRVSVGVDGSTDGRGTVIFEVFVDGKSVEKTPVISGFDAPRELVIPDLQNARNLILAVHNAGDGTDRDFANWVEGLLKFKVKDPKVSP